MELTKTTLDHIYNFKFNEAERNIRLLEKQIGSKPGLDLLKALHIYWQNLPLKQGSDAYKQYESYLNSTARQAEELLKKDGKDVEGIFFSLAGHGNLSAFYADEGSIMKAVGSARKAYTSLKKGFDLKDQYAEFYFTTGLYNYYREKYPEKRPVYKTFTWLFESGDKNLGIDQLKIASENALFTKAEAYYYLFHILLRYEKDAGAALSYSTKLYHAYPDNLLFQAFQSEALIFNKNYEEAEEIVEKLSASEKMFYRIPGNLFRGILLEKHYRNWNEAEKHYLSALSIADDDNYDVNYYKSLAWAGLARVADHHNDKAKAREFYNNSLKLGTYDIVTDEAKGYDP